MNYIILSDVQVIQVKNFKTLISRCLCIIVVLVFYVSSAFASAFFWSGSVNVVEDKKIKTVSSHQITFLNYEDAIKDKLVLEIETQGQWVKTEVPLEKISNLSITNWKTNGGSKNFGTGYTVEGVLTLKSGEQYKVRRIDTLRFGLEVRLKGPINDKILRHKIKSNKILGIEFGEEQGDYKVDSKGNVFPASYQYNPYNGEMLKVGPF